MNLGERVFGWLVRLYPRAFRAQYRDDLLAFFRQDRRHAKYGSGPLRPIRFWAATVGDLVRAVWIERRSARREREATTPRASSGLGRIGQDLRFAWRGLWAAPAVTLPALAVLVLGIGAGTAIFSVVDAVVLRGLPFPHDERLVSVAETYLASGQPIAVAPQDYLDWRIRQDAFEGMGAVAGAPAFTPADAPQDAFRTVRITASLFDVLQVKPALGRNFRPADERPGAAPVVILSDQLWRSHYHADPSIVGRTIASKTGTFEIVGVMPPGFTYPINSLAVARVDLWMPFVVTNAMTVRGATRMYNLSVVARLKPGITVADATARMKRIRDALAVEYPKWFRDHGVIVRRLQDAVVGASVRSWMLLLLGAVTLVVLMACLNAANLLVARAVARGPELAVRTALGASRWDLARALLVESLVLSGLGAAGGVAAALWGVDILRATLPTNVPRLATIGIDLRVIGVAVVAAVATGVVFGTLPALQASRPQVVPLLGQGGRSHSGSRTGQRARAVLVTAQIGLAVVLLSGSGLFLSSFLRVTSIDLGFDPRHVVAFLGSVMDGRALKPAETPQDQARAQSGQSLAADAVARVGAIPGVLAVAPMQDGRPLSGSWVSVPVQHADRRTPPFTDADELVVRSVGPAYLDVLRATVRAGRWIAPTDGPGAPPVVVLNDEAVRRYFGSRDPIGASLLMDGYARRVVGVVPGMRWDGPEHSIRPEGFIPFAQTSHATAELLVRTNGDPAALVPAIQRAIHAVMPQTVIGTPVFLEHDYEALLAQRRFEMVVLVLFGAVAIAIAAIGIFGLMTYLVEQRRREIGVRIALGAAPGGILSMVLGRAVRLLVAGLIPGLVVALALERTARAFLFKAQPHDPALYAGVALVLLLAGLAAAINPARRATRVDPLVALRVE